MATISLDAPPVNALAEQSWRDLAEAIRSASVDPEICVVVIAGSESLFCAGADIKELVAARGDRTTSLQVVSEVARAIRNASIPVIAAIGGPAHGGGLELALACDIRIAGPNASFAAAGVNMGLIASAGSLSRAIGDAAARRMLLTGERIGVERALQIGIISEVVTTGSVIERASEIAELIAAKPPLAVAAAKNALNAVPDTSTSDHDVLIETAFTDLAASNDHAEAIAAFIEKRPGTFTGT